MSQRTTYTVLGSEGLTVQLSLGYEKALFYEYTTRRPHRSEDIAAQASMTEVSSLLSLVLKESLEEMNSSQPDCKGAGAGCYDQFCHTAIGSHHLNLSPVQSSTKERI